MSSSIIWIGMDAHKDTVMVAVYVDGGQEPEVEEQLPNEGRKLRRSGHERGGHDQFEPRASNLAWVPARACREVASHHHLLRAGHETEVVDECRLAPVTRRNGLAGRATP